MDKKIERISLRRMQRISCIEDLVSSKSDPQFKLGTRAFKTVTKAAEKVLGGGGVGEDEKAPEEEKISEQGERTMKLFDYWRNQGILYIQQLKDTRADIKDIYMPADPQKNDFCSYWTEDCAAYAGISDWFFYAGTCLLLGTTAAYLFAFFDDGYRRRVGAYFCVVLCGLALVGVSVCVLIDRKSDMSKRDKQTRIKELLGAGVLSPSNLCENTTPCQRHENPERPQVCCLDCAEELYGSLQHIAACVNTKQRYRLHWERTSCVKKTDEPIDTKMKTLAEIVPKLAMLSQREGSPRELWNFCPREGVIDEEIIETIKKTLREVQELWKIMSEESNELSALEKCAQTIAALKDKQAEWEKLQAPIDAHDLCNLPIPAPAAPVPASTDWYLGKFLFDEWGRRG